VPYPLTFRQIGYRGIAETPVLKGISDFVMGRQLDDTPTVWQSMFHPDMLREQVAIQLGVQPRVIFTRHGHGFPTDGPSFHFEQILIALAFSLPLLVATWRRRFQRAALIFATIELTFWGALIWTLVVISSIPGVRWNEAVFIFVPFDIALPFLGAARRRAYARVRLAMVIGVSLLCAIGIFHQPLWVAALTAFLPFAIIAFDLPWGVMAARAEPVAPVVPIAAAVVAAPVAEIASELVAEPNPE